MRKKKILANTFMSIANQIITIICGLILPRLFLVYYGSEVNGLVSSITQFLSFVTFLEMGMGAVIQSNLYKPLAEGDDIQLSKVMLSARKFYRFIAFAFSIYIVLLCAVYPLTVRDTFNFFFTASLVVIISISMLMQYYFGAINQFLLSADEKSYIPLGLQSITLIINTVACYILMNNGFDIQIVKLGTAIIYLARPLGMYFYVKRKYNIDFSVKYDEEPIKQKWNGIAQHIAAMVLEHTDVAVLTIFTGLISVSIYTVYYNVISGIRRLFSTVIDSLRATFGRLLVKGDLNKLDVFFTNLEILMHGALSIAFGCTISLMLPFVEVYTKGINDATYIIPVFSALITIAYLFYCMRCFYNMPVHAAGHYKETQSSAIIECIINISVSILLVRPYGLLGVAIGTMCAMLYRTIYLVIYLSKNILNRNIRIFVKHFVIDMLIVISTYYITYDMKMNDVSYLSLFLLALIKFIICGIICIIIHFVFYYGEVKSLLLSLKSTIRRSHKDE